MQFHHAIINSGDWSKVHLGLFVGWVSFDNWLGLC